ncbi:hypothetical protein BDM02DRAFT_3169160 [Thelephora ganbajun]|uniref:Uncharacterized protein n=1 Tax=Thelephora ganbajun TaxID=370292 RepID=A0ACB6ZEN4_THEGA|nr:hypothetical protein BDM02DRAFT_3169160 [Thelephora ganbajun]
MQLRLAYYCSGHGYGHATRVSAFASALLTLDPAPVIYIVSSAPKHIFSQCMRVGANYRYAEIDPVIAQPLAYRVDRQKSIDVLSSFLKTKDSKVATEVEWLKSIEADCVLSDSAFLGCLAAKAARIPSILVTNFTFDSVYSYMSTLIVDTTPSLLHPDLLDTPGATTLFPIDRPIPIEEVSPLVDQVHAGFRCADLLLRLPGAIPIPSFAIHPPLPSPGWVDVTTHSFSPEIVDHLLEDPSSRALHPSIPFPLVSQDQAKIPAPPRSIIQSSLLVRPPNPSVYTPEGRSRFLSSIGVPKSAHDPDETKILIVSFGGQIFHTPRSRSTSPAPTRPVTPNHLRRRSERHTQVTPDASPDRSRLPIVDLTITNGVLVKGVPPFPRNTKGKLKLSGLPVSSEQLIPEGSIVVGSPTTTVLADFTNSPTRRNTTAHLKPHKISVPLRRSNSQRIATDQHLWLPGAPGAARKSEFTSPTTSYTPGFEATGSLLLPSSLPTVITTPPTPSSSVLLEKNQKVAKYISHSYSNPPSGFVDAFHTGSPSMEIPRLLPEGWIAVVCGASKEQDEGAEHLPEGFYIAPKDVYMPDLSAVADVLLGKLGYGSVSEALDSRTPFVYVSRPLFIEEHGLRLLLERDGVGVELSRDDYEGGNWATAVERAWNNGSEAKRLKRLEGETGKRQEQVKEMGRRVVDWIVDWKWKRAEQCVDEV